MPKNSIWIVVGFLVICPLVGVVHATSMKKNKIYAPATTLHVVIQSSLIPENVVVDNQHYIIDIPYSDYDTTHTYQKKIQVHSPWAKIFLTFNRLCNPWDSKEKRD